MENSINDKIKALQNDAENQAESMKKLAEFDEEGQLTDDMLEQISGGTGKFGPLVGLPIFDLPVLGGITVSPFPDVITTRE